MTSAVVWHGDERTAETGQEESEKYGPSEWHTRQSKRRKTKPELIKTTTPTAVRFGISYRAHCAIVASTSQAISSEIDVESATTAL